MPNYRQPPSIPINFNEMASNPGYVSRDTLFVTLGAVGALAIGQPSSGLGAFGYATLGGALGCWANNVFQKGNISGDVEGIKPALASGSTAGLGAAIGYSVADYGQRGAYIGAIVVPFAFRVMGWDLSLFT